MRLKHKDPCRRHIFLDPITARRTIKFFYLDVNSVGVLNLKLKTIASSYRKSDEAVQTHQYRQAFHAFRTSRCNFKVSR